MKYQLHKPTDYGVNLCEGCLEKQREIDRLREEVQRLKARLNQRERKQKEGVFGSSTPSSLKPLKANSEQDQSAKRGGAKNGHPGHGRRACSVAEADEIRRVELTDRCPDCGGQLGVASIRTRTVAEIDPVVVKRICYELERRSCGNCRKSFQAQAPAVLPKSLLGNQLLSEIIGEHYLQGVPLSSLTRRFGLNLGTVIDALHRVGSRFHPALKQLKEEYRRAGVRHADETGWRTDGHNGYSWLFCTDRVSVCLYRRTRSASVVREVLGEKELDGVLVVDRYNGYNKAKCRIQYCYAHLLRDVEDLRDEFADEAEVQTFTTTVIPLLSEAMHLHGKALSDEQYYRAARKIKRQIEQAMGDEIRALDWMSPATKKKALEKLATVVNKVGYPDRWRDYTGVRIARDDLLGNVQRATGFEVRRQIAKIGQPVDRSEWGMTPPTVNAYYNPQTNDINFPAGILQPPLFDPKMDDAPNYGNTGSTIGHELTHGFDDEGRQFDAQGNLKNWWAPKDEKAFNERTQCLVDQYAKYTIVDDIKINSKLTLGEDLADLGGLLLGLIAWKAETATAPPPAERDGFTPLQRFFIGFGQWACENVRPEEARIKALTDPHSPGRWRVNGLVVNFPEFEQAFACKSGQAMAPAKRCRVW